MRRMAVLLKHGLRDKAVRDEQSRPSEVSIRMPASLGLKMFTAL